MTTKQSHGRIPVALQAVFLASNRGEEVNTPPPGNVAFRMFQSMFQRNNNKQTQEPASQANRGFFGMTKTRMRRASTKDIIHNSKGQPRRASATHVPSFGERTCPIRDISFECASPTRSRQTTSTYKTKMMSDSAPDDVSIASSVTFTVLHNAKKKTKKSKKVKVRIHLCFRVFKSAFIILLTTIYTPNASSRFIEHATIVLRCDCKSSRIYQETLLCTRMRLSQQDHTYATIELSRLYRWFGQGWKGRCITQIICHRFIDQSSQRTWRRFDQFGVSVRAQWYIKSDDRCGLWCASFGWLWSYTFAWCMLRHSPFMYVIHFPT